MKELIKIRQNGNIVKIPGVDEFADSKIFLRALPRRGIHRGISLCVECILPSIRENLNFLSHIHFEGHSMGGSLCIEIARQLAILHPNTVFYVEAQAPFPCYTRKIKKPPNLYLNIREYGNDPITRIIPWFKQLDVIKHEGTRRTLFGPLLQLFKMQNGDHVKYWD